MDDKLRQEVMQKVKLWLNADIDEASKAEIQHMMQSDENLLIESFYKELEFGTGGMRGIMGIGPNRMNKYTVAMATQGLANYLNKRKPFMDKKAAIAYDCRNNSSFFAHTAAEILSANGIKVYLFDALRPTPELSFAIRELKCDTGIVITASHNPKEYNGYKVYWEDGGQIIAPHDKGIIDEVRAINSPSDVAFETNSKLIHEIGDEIDKKYIAKIKTLSLSPNAIRKHADMPIVFTPIHGTSVKLGPETLRTFGFTNIINVPEQDISDGNFPTVKSPNPEEPEAFTLALKKAKATNAELVMGTDPDADRVGIIVRKKDGTYQLLNGNQTATILIYYLLTKWKEAGKITGNEYIVKTIVTTELLGEIADSFGVESFDTLTGFKYIADKIRELEGEKQFIVGGEESYGYLAGDFVRDKDAIISCALIAEAAAWAKEANKTLWDVLMDIYTEYSCFHEALISIKKEGKTGAEAIAKMMDDFRYNTPESFNGQQILMIHDFEKQQAVDKISDLRYSLTLPKSNVLQFILEDGSKISIRPSGTEPKIKFYFSVRTKMNNPADYPEKRKLLEKRIDSLIKALKITE
jgi:phosphoglucomutase